MSSKIPLKGRERADPDTVIGNSVPEIFLSTNWGQLRLNLSPFHKNYGDIVV